TPDAPAPTGEIPSTDNAAVTIGLQPADPAASISILYRINHGAPATVPAAPTHRDGTGKQYFQARLSGFKNGDKVEYVPIYRSGRRQLPSNMDAEKFVASFTLKAEPASAAADAHPVAQHQAPPAEDPRLALHEVLRAAKVLPSAVLEDAFVAAYFNHEGDPAAFWEDLGRRDNLKPYVGRLQFVLQVDLLMSGHLPAIEAVLHLPGVQTMADLARLDEPAWQRLVEQTGVPPHFDGASHEDQVRRYMASIVTALQAAYPTLAILRIAKDSHDVDQRAVTFLENAPNFDIRNGRVDTYAAHHAATIFKGIAEADRGDVLKEVKRLQRLAAVSTDPEAFRSLLGTKFGSAHAIAVVPGASFVSHYGHSFGGPAAAAALHERAQFIDARNLHMLASVRGSLHTPPTRALGHYSPALQARLYARHPTQGRIPGGEAGARMHLRADHGSPADNLSERIPNATELFGSLSICSCAECESAIGPAAYLVETLDFLGHSQPNQHGMTPLDVLIGNPEKQVPGRRPDLAFLNLTCANTNTAMPYIDIVNEILESYIALGMRLDRSAAHDTGEATTAELDANPQHIQRKAYRMLDQAAYPFTLPFNRPLQVARLYLGQLGTSRHEILRTFQKNLSNPRTRRLLAAEFIGISAEEFPILTGAGINPQETVHPRPAAAFYGYADIDGGRHDGVLSQHADWVSNLAVASTFMQRTGLSFPELRALAATQFIRSEAHVAALGRKRPHSPQMPPALAPDSEGSALHLPAAPSGVADSSGEHVMVLEQPHAHHSMRLKGAWPNKAVVLEDPEGSCDPASMRLRHADGSALDEGIFERMQRFIRLYRKTGWTVTDLDRVIRALKHADIDADLLIQISCIKRLQARLHITDIQTLLALWSPIETKGPDALYRTLFLNRATYHAGVDPMFEQDDPDSDVLVAAGEVALPHLPKLCSAMRVSAQDMALIFADAGLDPATSPLTLETVSALYRRAALAKALHLRVADLLALRSMMRPDPFEEPEATEAFADGASMLTASGLTVPLLNHVIRHVVDAGKPGFEPRETDVLGAVVALRTGIAAIVRDNAPAADPNGTLTAQKLAALFDSDVVDALVGIIKGAVQYSATLVALPSAVVFPPQLAKKIRFDPVAQLLSCKSPLTAADRATLFVLSADPAYHAAVESLYRQPLDLIATTLDPILEDGAAQARLVTDSASLDGDLH
ncbi:MAG: hypothetical protein JO227_18560, partial [Acetobacteraceae bacterium]|nr:hypothetical protein [Acetobacteraceae bacterium]